ncbi:TIGR01777 family oxidoreductase [Actinoplanes sp. NEAU-A12]|uniref:TIGR01777 family oxidoreductase n=1 Tax=Actinoplanes sandaracinus TaxID=3045177 RepID=A0ABT6WIN2_9ACTN|nr:TIGR01777 family oxidoreductase [Actinoplanes sandaracinus]MDI6099587.1 TIGR01777 family oxidoreductase [Actinoplanes sandaracinus]
MKVVIAGGSGALGQRIARDLTGRGDDVVVLSRSATRVRWGRQVHWDGRTLGPWAAELSGAALINLCGELVFRRPTPAGIALLTRSRTEPTRALARACAALDRPVPVLLQMSTLAIYGDAGEATLDESAPPADGPPQMAGVARAWEEAAEQITAARRVTLRTGIVFDRDTPAFDRLTGFVRWGLGGRMGSGRQWISWLHIDDLCAIVRHCLDDPAMSGIVHVTSPHPVRNSDLMAALRHAMGRSVGLPSPAPLVRLGSVFMRADPLLVLTGRRCVPKRLQDAGFEFRHPRLRLAVADLLRGGA